MHGGGAPPPPPPAGPPPLGPACGQPQAQPGVQFGGQLGGFAAPQPSPVPMPQHPLLGGGVMHHTPSPGSSSGSLLSDPACGAVVPASNQALNLAMLAGGNPMMDLLMKSLQGGNQPPPQQSGKNKRKSAAAASVSSGGGSNDNRRPRATSSEVYPQGRDTIASLPEEDILSLLERLEPVQFNRYCMIVHDRATRNACVMFALNHGLNDKIVSMNRAQHEMSCVHRYEQLGKPLAGKTPEEVLKLVMGKLGASNTGVGYSIHNVADGRQFLHNGMTSRWIDERVGLNAPPPLYNLFISNAGQSYISNGLQTAWAENVFKEHPPQSNNNACCIARLRQNLFQQGP